MLRINLLPPERRKLKRTPIYALVPLVLGVALVVGSLALAGIFLAEWNAIKGEIESVKQQIAELEPKAKRHDELQALIQQKETGIASIERVTQRSVYWGESIGAITEVVSKNQRIWVDEISYLDAGRAGSVAGRFGGAGQPTSRPTFGILIKCNSSLDVMMKEGKLVPVTNIAYMAKFRNDLREHPKLKLIFSDFHPKNLEWSLGSGSGDDPGYAIFEVYLLSTKGP